MNIHIFCDEKKFWDLGLVRIHGHATAVNLLQTVKEKLSVFDLDMQKDVVSLITDGARVMLKIKTISGLEHQLCVAHGVQLAVLDTLYDSPTASKEKFCEEVASVSSDDSDGDDDTETGGLQVEMDKSETRLRNKRVRETIGKIRKLGKSFKMSGRLFLLFAFHICE
jgi:hypothetical protein